MSVDCSPFRGGHTAGSPPGSQACRISGVDLTTVEIKLLFCAAFKWLCVSPPTTHASWTFLMLVLVQTALTGLDARWPWAFVNHQIKSPIHPTRMTSSPKDSGFHRSEHQTRFKAGSTRRTVFHPSRGTLQRWSLIDTQPAGSWITNHSLSEISV